MKEQVQTNPAAGSEMAAKKTQHQKIVAMVQIALFAAIIAVCSWIQIPMTVPFTMQTFAVFCALATLGGKGGTISVLIYIVLGAVGVPVFAGFTGQKLDQFLNAMRKQKIPKINLKAMLTEHNVKWDSMTLHDELAREHEAMNKK